MRTAISILTVAIVLAAAGAGAQNPVAPNEVRLCEHDNYQGACHSYFLDPNLRHRLVRHLPTALDDKVSSMWIGGDVDVYVFRDHDFKGPSQLFFRENPKIPGPPLRPCGTYTSQSWNDKVSSLIIVRPQGGCRHPEPANQPVTAVAGVYLDSSYDRDPNCRQQYFPLPENPAQTEVRIPNLGQYMDNWAETVASCGVEVELYPDPHFKGAPVVLREGVPSGDYWWRLADYGIKHKVSSLVIRPVGGMIVAREALPLPPPERGGEAAGEPHRAPPAGLQEAIIPGQIAMPGSTSLALQYDTDRPGHDYHNVDLAEARPELCRDLCAQDPKCRAFTYVGPGIQGPKARCWLKDMASRPQAAKGLVSGVKH